MMSSCISNMYVMGLQNVIHLAGQSCPVAGYLIRIVTIWILWTAKHFWQDELLSSYPEGLCCTHWATHSITVMCLMKVNIPGQLYFKYWPNPRGRNKICVLPGRNALP